MTLAAIREVQSKINAQVDDLVGQVKRLVTEINGPMPERPNAGGKTTGTSDKPLGLLNETKVTQNYTGGLLDNLQVEINRLRDTLLPSEPTIRPFGGKTMRGIAEDNGPAVNLGASRLEGPETP